MQCQGFALCFVAFANVIFSFRKMKMCNEKIAVMAVTAQPLPL